MIFNFNIRTKRARELQKCFSYTVLPLPGMAFNPSGAGAKLGPLTTKPPDSIPPPFLIRSSSPSSLLSSPPRFSPTAQLDQLSSQLDPLGLQKKLQEQARLGLLGHNLVRFPGPNSIYEMAALTQELNTLQLTTKVREVLSTHNIGQKVNNKCKMKIHYINNNIYSISSSLVRQSWACLRDQ